MASFWRALDLEIGHQVEGGREVLVGDERFADQGSRDSPGAALAGAGSDFQLVSAGLEQTWLDLVSLESPIVDESAAGPWNIDFPLSRTSTAALAAAGEADLSFRWTKSGPAGAFSRVKPACRPPASEAAKSVPGILTAGSCAPRQSPGSGRQ